MQDFIVTTPFPWPPVYQLRKSLKAKRVSLSISKSKGLEVIVPYKSRKEPDIEALFNEKRRWIEKNLAPILLNTDSKPQELIKPLWLDLKAIQKLVTFTYQKTEHKLIRIKSCSEIVNNFIVIGPIDNDHLVFRALRRWLTHTAYQTFSPWLHNLSQKTGLMYHDLSIRSQSTLWGSCNAKKRISLNNKLLFIPEHLVNYILLHELCHTRHLNHSQRYWNLLKTFDPDCLKHRKEMRQVLTYIPPWLE